jgi:type IV pilus assembly protein PilB
MAFTRGGGPPKTEFWVGRGCNFCAGTGYLDRIGVYELLRITPEIKRLIVGWATQDELRRLAVQQGMRTLRDDAIDLVANDVTTISEVVRGIYAL